MSDETPDELSQRAEIFRSKLIEDFQLIDIIANRGDTEPPKYYSNEVTGTSPWGVMIILCSPYSATRKT